ncbi:MAG: S8 family serine peptidase [Calditrichaeota bacterium]|nr:S8 family serine peptidase [Calditrichota bacterium]MCB9391053.1 S8 family serine peptidase [Calditrichota bacterium]
MKTWILGVLLIPSLTCSALEYPDGTQWLPGRVLVNFAPSVGELQTTRPLSGLLTLGVPEVDAVLSAYGVGAMYRIVPDQVLGKLEHKPDAYRLVAMTFPEDYDVLEVCDALNKLPEVVIAEPDITWPVSETIPDDPFWNQQWDKRLMSCDLAWDFGQGSRDIIAVAVDNGFWWPHLDARDNLWVNPGEDLDNDGVAWSFDDYPGDIDDLNGLDDDGNGYPDDFIGWDFIDNIGGCATGEDCDNPDNDTKSVGDHGTHVLGAIGAVGNNDLGVAGCNWNMRIMASRAGYVPQGGEGLIVTSAAIATINWAVAHGVDVINMSYGGPGFSNTVNNTIQAAWQNGVLLCAASGNDGVSSIQYPCGYDNVVCVGSVNNSDAVSGFSNYGTWVDCYAPGEGTQSLSTNNGYANLQGTSMASPNAAGVFALVWSIVPGLNNAQLRDLVLPNCVDISAINPGYDPTHLGFGRIDAAQALAAIYPYLEVQSAYVVGDTDNDGRLEAGESAELQLTVSNDPDWFNALNVQVTVTSDDPNVTLSNAEYTIGNLEPGLTTTLTNPEALISCSGGVVNAYSTVLTVHFEFDDGTLFSKDVLLRLGRAPLLFVDDDGSAGHANYFATALTTLDYNFDEYSTALDGAISDETIEEYDFIIWGCGNENTNTLTQSDRDALEAYMNAGNDLMFCSQGADEDADLRNSAFYADYLHASSGSAGGGTQVTAVAGDVISDGANLVLIGGGCAGNGSVSPSVLNAVNDGVIFYTYQTNGLGGAVRFQNSTYQSVYFGFAVEAACGAVGTTHYSEVVRRVLEWFGATGVSEEPGAPLPSDFKVSRAYPNPFNPESVVDLDIPRASHVRATLHNVLGRQVDIIADRTIAAGVHQLRVDGRALPSGSYWLNITVDNHPHVQRIVLLK